MNKKRLTFNNFYFYLVLIAPILIVYVLFFVIPVVSSMLFSLTNFNGVNLNFKWVGFNNYDVLIHDIVTGQIALGDRLINRELQTRFGVSSTPIRDAINKLYQDGLIRELTNSGAQLIDFDQQYAEELNHFIMMLACEALALAAQSDQQAEIVRLLHEFRLDCQRAF